MTIILCQYDVLIIAHSKHVELTRKPKMERKINPTKQINHNIYVSTSSTLFSFLSNNKNYELQFL